MMNVIYNVRYNSINDNTFGVLIKEQKDIIYVRMSKSCTSATKAMESSTYGVHLPNKYYAFS